MCFQPGIPKIKQIIIYDSNHLNQDGREENMRFSSHTEYKVLFCLCWICLIPLPVSLIGCQQWGGLLFCHFWCCVYSNVHASYLPLYSTGLQLGTLNTTLGFSNGLLLETIPYPAGSYSTYCLQIQPLRLLDNLAYILVCFIPVTYCTYTVTFRLPFFLYVIDIFVASRKSLKDSVFMSKIQPTSSNLFTTDT